MALQNEINQNLVYLSENLTNITKVLIHLLQHGIITPEDSENIKYERTDFSKTASLLTLVQKKGWPDIKTDFINILRDTGNQHCAKKIEETLITALVPETINEKIVYLSRNITNLDKVLTSLKISGIISEDERQQIKSKETEETRNIETLSFVHRKGWPSLKKEFLEILSQTGNAHCVKIIEQLPTIISEVKYKRMLNSKWWPEEKSLPRSFYERKFGDCALVDKLKHTLNSKSGNGMTVITQKITVSGLGGVGKTVTAKWFAVQFQADYEHILWIDCGEGSLLKSFKMLARVLKVEDWQDIDLKQLAADSFDILKETKCLFIFDNAERYVGQEGIKDVLPKNFANFDVIITSRNKDWGHDTGDGEVPQFQLDVFDKFEGLEFLKRNIKNLSAASESKLENLCDLLGNLPLALQMAVATLNRQKIESLDKYIEDIQNTPKLLYTTFDEYEKTIDKTMKISLSLIKNNSLHEGKNIGDVAYNVLRIFGYITPDDVHSDFFIAVHNPTPTLYSKLKSMFYISEQKFDASVDKSDLDAATDLLESYSLITKSKIHENFYYLSVHRLLQQVIRHNENDSKDKILQQILNCEGFLEYKLIPYSYADENLQYKFLNIQAEMMDKLKLRELLHQRRLKEAVELSRIMKNTLRTPISQFNFAMCLKHNSEYKESKKVLKSLLEKDNLLENVEHWLLELYSPWGILDAGVSLPKDIIGGYLFLLYLKDNEQIKAKKLVLKVKNIVILPNIKPNDIIRFINSTSLSHYYLKLANRETDTSFNSCLQDSEQFVLTPQELSHNSMILHKNLPSKLQLSFYKIDEQFLCCNNLDSLVLFNCDIFITKRDLISAKEISLNSVKFHCILNQQNITKQPHSMNMIFDSNIVKIFSINGHLIQDFKLTILKTEASTNFGRCFFYDLAYFLLLTELPCYSLKCVNDGNEVLLSFPKDEKIKRLKLSAGSISKFARFPMNLDELIVGEMVFRSGFTAPSTPYYKNHQKLIMVELHELIFIVRKNEKPTFFYFGSIEDLISLNGNPSIENSKTLINDDDSLGMNYDENIFSILVFVNSLNSNTMCNFFLNCNEILNITSLTISADEITEKCIWISCYVFEPNSKCRIRCNLDLLKLKSVKLPCSLSEFADITKIKILKLESMHIALSEIATASNVTLRHMNISEWMPGAESLRTLYDIQSRITEITLYSTAINISLLPPMLRKLKVECCTLTNFSNNKTPHHLQELMISNSKMLISANYIVTAENISLNDTRFCFTRQEVNWQSCLSNVLLLKVIKRIQKFKINNQLIDLKSAVVKMHKRRGFGQQFANDIMHFLSIIKIPRYVLNVCDNGKNITLSLKTRSKMRVAELSFCSIPEIGQIPTHLEKLILANTNIFEWHKIGAINVKHLICQNVNFFLSKSENGWNVQSLYQLFNVKQLERLTVNGHTISFRKLRRRLNKYQRFNEVEVFHNVVSFLRISGIPCYFLKYDNNEKSINLLLDEKCKQKILHLSSCCIKGDLQVPTDLKKLYLGKMRFSNGECSLPCDKNLEKIVQIKDMTFVINKNNQPSFYYSKMKEGQPGLFDDEKRFVVHIIDFLNLINSLQPKSNPNLLFSCNDMSAILSFRQDGFRNTSRKICLSHCNFCYVSENTQILCQLDELALKSVETSKIITQFVNVNQIKRLILQDMKINMSEKVTINEVILRNVEVLDWTNANWTIGKLFLYHVDFVYSTELTITELMIEDSSVKIFVIPTSVQKLVLKNSFLISGLSASTVLSEANSLKFRLLNSSSISRIEAQNEMMVIQDFLWQYLSCSMEHLTSIKSLHFMGCSLNVHSDIQISSSELHFKGDLTLDAESHLKVKELLDIHSIDEFLKAESENLTNETDGSKIILLAKPRGMWVEFMAEVDSKNHTMALGADHATRYLEGISESCQLLPGMNVNHTHFPSFKELKSFKNLTNYLPAIVSVRVCSNNPLDAAYEWKSVIVLNENTARTLLQVLHLRNCKELTDEKFETLMSHFPVDIDIHNCPKLTSKTLNTINRYGKNLKTIFIGNTIQIFPKSLFELNTQCDPTYPKLLITPNVYKLAIWGLHLSQVADNEDYWKSLTGEFVENLLYLDLSGCVEIPNLNFLEKAKKLSFLSLHNVSIKAEISWNILKGMHELRHLDISQSAEKRIKFSDENTLLSSLVESLPHLISLDISGTNLGGWGDGEGVNQTNASEISGIPGLNSRLSSPLEFLGLYGTYHDASCRDHIPANRITGDKNEAQLLQACESYMNRPEILKKVLLDLFQLIRAGSGIETYRSLNLILEIMNEHLVVKPIQISGLAILVYLVKKHDTITTCLSLKREILTTLINVMDVHKFDTILINAVIDTIYHFKIPEDVMFKYEKLVSILLEVLCSLHVTQEVVENIVIDLLNTLTSQVERSHKLIVGELGAVQKMIQLIESRLIEQNCDDVMETAWSILCNAANETPENCECFLDERGMELFFSCLTLFPNEPELLNHMLGVLENVAEVSYLRPDLMTSEFITVLYSLLDSTQDRIEISHSSAYILVHILSDKNQWTIYSPTRQQVLDHMRKNINRWNIHSNRDIIYESLEPILTLLKVDHTEECKLWAAWELTHLTRVNPAQYVPMLTKENGLEFLSNLENDDSDLGYYAKLTIDHVKMFIGRKELV